MSISKANTRIEGTWTIQSVKNRIPKDGKWGSNDVSNNFENWTFTFNADGTATLFVPDEGLNLNGGWEIYESVDYDDDDGSTTISNNLYMYFDHPTNFDIYREFYWHDMKISKSKFKASSNRVLNGTSTKYFYTLSR